MELKGWDSIYKKHGIVQKECLKKVIEFADVIEKRNAKKVLDLGCGTGRHTIYLANKGFEMTSTDISDTGIEMLNGLLKDLGIENVTTNVHDMRKIPYKDESFDAVLCTLAIDHGTEWQVKKSVEEIFRVLRKGGYCLVDFMDAADESHGLGIQIEEHTFVGSMEGEENIAHHYSTYEELESIFSQFDSYQIQPMDYTYYYKDGTPYIIKSFDVTATK